VDANPVVDVVDLEAGVVDAEAGPLPAAADPAAASTPAGGGIKAIHSGGSKGMITAAKEGAKAILPKWPPFGRSASGTGSTIESESRELGISLQFVADIFPDEAQEKTRRLVNDVLPGKANRSVEEEELLVKYGGKSFWSMFKNTIDVKHMDFIDLSKITAYGDVAYGKGVRCPRDGLPDCSIVDAVYSKGFSQKATIFLSWVWGYKLAMAISALKNYCATHPTIKREECFIWWCFFQNNQFRMLGSDEKQSFDSLREIFGTQLRHVGRMVCMMDRVADSSYADRLWCLFEVYVATEGKIPTEVMLPEEATKEVESLIASGGFGKVKAAIKVEAENAKASFAEDETGIKTLIERMPGSYATVNERVRKSLRRSVLVEFAKALND
jgi:hypothetical protein